MFLRVWLKLNGPRRPGCHFKTAIFNLVLLIAIFRFAKDNALRRMLQDLTDDKSTLVQVMTWCRQATSHYLSQCWPSSMSPYDVTRPQWVNNMAGLVPIMAWCRTGNKPLSEVMMLCCTNAYHICLTQPHWVNSSPTPRRIWLKLACT